MNVKKMLEEQLGRKIPTDELCAAYKKNLRITSGEEVGINFLNQAVQVYKVILGNPKLQLGLKYLCSVVVKSKGPVNLQKTIVFNLCFQN